MEAVWIGLREACRLNLRGIRAEGDSSCAIQRASGLYLDPWSLVNAWSEEAIDLCDMLTTTFLHVRRSTTQKQIVWSRKESQNNL